MSHLSWQRIPLTFPGCSEGYAWLCESLGLVAVYGGTGSNSVGWCILSASDPWPHLSIDGKTLTFAGYYNGSLAMSGTGNATLAFYPSLGWVYRPSGGFKAPRTYLDYDGVTRLGDDYYVTDSSNVPDAMPGRIRRTSQVTVAFDGYGPNVHGDSLTGTWLWPRLQAASRLNVSRVAAKYASAADGWTGAAAVFLGNATFSAGSRGTLSVNAAGDACGPATLQGVVWAIGTIGSGAWLQTSDDLRSCDEGDTVVFSPQYESGYDGETLQSESWTCSGRTIGDETATILVADCARWQ